MAGFENRLTLALALSAALITPAAAQTTRCVREGVEVVCRQDRPTVDIGAFQFDDSVAAYQRGYDKAGPSAGSATARLAAQMVARGDCEGARKLALSASDLVLAKQVQDVCQPATNGR